MEHTVDSSTIDLFCGIGGLSYGLQQSGLKVVAGLDVDETCQFAYEENVGAEFISQDISLISGKDLNKRFGNASIKILVGCAPCQPFSTHSFKYKDKPKSKKWFLINEFRRLITETQPDIVSMENVPNLENQNIFCEFVSFLEENKYKVSYTKVYCPDYGIPQRRRRLVLLASKLGEIKLIPPTHSPDNYVTLQDAISDLPPIKAGDTCATDPLHFARNLTSKNILRIKASKPNGTWKDWDEELQLACHKKPSGRSYTSVYGRMAWDEPSSTITTQFFNYGTGRFGHPEQDRALSLREGALLQTFPMSYKFVEEGSAISMTRIGTHIGNAVPVDLGIIIGKSIQNHIGEYDGESKLHI